MVGELAIAQSMLRQHDNIKASTNRELDQIINQLNLIISGLQKTAMSLRMVPIKIHFKNASPCKGFIKKGKQRGPASYVWGGHRNR